MFFEENSINLGGGPEYLAGSISSSYHSGMPKENNGMMGGGIGLDDNSKDYSNTSRLILPELN